MPIPKPGYHPMSYALGLLGLIVVAQNAHAHQLDVDTSNRPTTWATPSPPVTPASSPATPAPTNQVTPGVAPTSGGETQPDAPSPQPTPAAPQPLPAPTPSSTAVPAQPPSQTKPPDEASQPPPPEPGFRLRGYGGPLAKLTLLNRQFGALIGLRGGVLLGKRVSLGAALHYLMLPVEIDPQTPDPVRALNLNYAGAAVGVTVAQVRDRLQFELLTLLGGGGACWQNRTQGSCEDRVGFFVAEPEFYMHINVVKYFRISLGAGYRFVAAGAWSGPGSWRLAGPVGTVMLAFGKF